MRRNRESRGSVHMELLQQFVFLFLSKQLKSKPEKQVSVLYEQQL